MNMMLQHIRVIAANKCLSEWKTITNNSNYFARLFSTSNQPSLLLFNSSKMALLPVLI